MEKVAMRVIEEVRRNKAQKNMKAHQSTRQESGCLPFHRSDERSTAFIPSFCCDGLAAYRGC